MAFTITLSSDGQLALTLATDPAITLDLWVPHRLGEHEDFDDSVLTTAFVITRQSDGTFAMEAVGGGGGTFLSLTDTPSGYGSSSLQFVRVNVGETALEFATPAGAGDMTAAVYDAAAITEQLVGLTAAQSLSTKTLVLPIIVSFANATHDHSDPAGGGTVAISATTGTLAVARGGTGVTASTGTVAVVLSTSPTIITPTIVSFVNATHDHLAPAGGGVLSAAAITSGTLPVARGGTGVTASTGTVAVVLSTSPEIITPTIASFTNSAHDHSDAAGGGTIAISATTGTLAVARGGTGVTASTGTVAVVLSTSPTIITPTIASFANATHDHTTGAGGGTLGATAVSFAIFQDVKENCLLGRDTLGSGSSQDLDETDLATVSPAGADFIIGWTAAGLLRKYTITSLPAGGEVNALEADGTQGIENNEMLVGTGSDTAAYVASTGTGAPVRTTSPTLVTPIIATAGTITDAGGDAYVTFFEVGTPIVSFGMAQGLTTDPCILSAGGEANAGMQLTGSGTGTVEIIDPEIAATDWSNANHTHQGATTGGTIQNRFRPHWHIEDPPATDKVGLFFTPVAITMQEFRAVLEGSATPSLTFNIQFDDDYSEGSPSELWSTDEVITNVTTGDAGASFDDATIPADSWVWFQASAQSGTVDAVNIFLDYLED